MDNGTLSNEFTSKEMNILQNWERRLQRGFLSFIILKNFMNLENGEPIKLNGQGIKNKIKTRTRGMWSPSPGSIYPILAEMEKQGIIQQTESENNKNKNYAATDFGVRLYTTLVENAMLFRPPIHESSPSVIDMNKLIRRNLDSLSLREVKTLFEDLKSRLEFMESYLKERIITDKEY